MHYATTTSTAAAMNSSHYQPLPHTPWTDLNIKLERIEDNLTSTTSSSKNSSNGNSNNPSDLHNTTGKDFDPSTRAFTRDELRPQPIIKKKRKVRT